MNNVFEHLAARFVSRVAKRVPAQCVSLVFTSPLSARSSDVGLLWHPGYREKHVLSLFLRALFSLMAESVKGLVRFVFRIKSWGYALYGDIGDTLLVVPASCGHFDENRTFSTSYIEIEKDDGLFIFGKKTNCGPNGQSVQTISVKQAWLLTYTLLESGVFAFQEIEGRLIDRLHLLFYWLSWVMSLRWLQEYYLELSLVAIVKKYKIKKIGCIHDLQAYARVVWKVAEQCNAKGYTIQHASLSLGKRGYVCYPEEFESGLKLADVMYVYNKKIADTLKPLYPRTHFFLGCSARYAHWKNIQPRTKRGEYCLFVGALAQFDNETLFSSMRALLRIVQVDIPVRLRLHPFAEISYRDTLWLWMQKKKRLVDISKHTPLNSDIQKALVVIGMSTTVLQEAILLGCPVIQLSHPYYLQSVDFDGIEGVLKRDYRILSIDDLREASHLSVDSHAMEGQLGLQNPVVTYKRLFLPPGTGRL